MKHKTARIKRIRKRFGIPEEGFISEKEAMDWYKQHFHHAKGVEFKGSFGFRYNPLRSMLEFDYQIGRDKFSISPPYPLDAKIPLDREVYKLIDEKEVPSWAAPALRLVVLMGNLLEELNIHIPFQLLAPLGDFRLLLQPAQTVSLRQWRRTGEMLGILPSDVDMWKVPGTIEVYSIERKSKKRDLYWQAYLAYQEAIYERRCKGRIGKRGILIETAKILKNRYHWEVEPDSYTVRRYLDRAEKIWHLSTHDR